MKILDKIPEAEDFYANYWGKQPFVIKNAIDKEYINNILDQDELAGLSLEEDIRSRIVKSNKEEQNWTCQHGPFEEDIFQTLGEENWSLLVQNVDQYIPETANLLQNFNFTPRWLLDDIMVSYSCKGGSVGPHLDSYHVFLVQGKGSRKWKLGNAPILDENLIEGLDLKILENGFEGTEIEVSCGDVIYIPPNFGHEGITTEESLTFSLGFLGPSTSELLIQYGVYLGEQEKLNTRYSGKNINKSSSGFIIDKSEITNIKDNVINSINSDNFNQWIVKYFSAPTHLCEDEISDLHDEVSNQEEGEIQIPNDAIIYKEENKKLTLTKIKENQWSVGFLSKTRTINDETANIITRLNNGEEIAFSQIIKNDEASDLITQLYNLDIIS